MIHDKINISVTGDLAPVKQTANLFKENTEYYRTWFSELFAFADIVFCNLETPITEKGTIRENKKYIFRTDKSLLDVFPQKIIFSIANNHILDFGHDGLLQTIQNLNDKEILFSGAGKNLEEAGKPVIIKQNGKTIGFLAAADSRYQAATENTPGIYPAKSELLIPNIEKLKKEADIIYVSIHMGMEYIPAPTPAMIELAGKCRRAGANVVFFHHAHCLSGYTLEANGAVLWGTGNFVFPKRKKFPFKAWFNAACWDFTHLIQSDEINLNIRPFQINENGIPETPDHRKSAQILKNIEKLNIAIHQGKHKVLIFKNIFKLSYIRVVLANYFDMVRRQGLKKMFQQVSSSVKVMFNKEN